MTGLRRNFPSLRMGACALWLSLLPGALRAQEAAAPPGPAAVTVAGESTEGPGDVAAAAAQAGPVVQLRGVVAFVSQAGDYFHVMVGSRAEGFRVAAPVVMPGFGQEVEVDYRETSALSGGFDAVAIRVLGQGQLPEPTRCTPDDDQAGRYNRHWVEVEGVVLQVKYASGFLWIQLAGAGGWGSSLGFRRLKA